MAKGSNNLTGKRSSSHSGKPYDANNSFVKKVATKVTDFIPQRSWISKWFNMSQDNGDALNDTENPEETEFEEDIQKPPPLKRPRICMDVTHPPGTFVIQPRIKPSVTKETPSKEQYNIDNESLQSEDFLEPASAGPSGLGGLVSSTPATQTDIRNMAQRTELNSLVSGPSNGTANGTDDNSESSESTSGCSSLIPQTNRQEAPSSVTYNSSYDDRKRFIDDKMNFTSHLQSPRSLFLDSNSRDSLSSRKPSFNASVMTNTLDRASPLSSPFYSGNITFGGANAVGFYKRSRTLFNNTNEQYQLKTPGRRTSVQVKPSNAAGIDSSGMSQTAKKILEALEHFSSPISDAKKIPVKSTNNSPLLSMSKKRTREEAESPSPRVGLRHLTRELTIPTVPDILKLRRRQKLQDTTVAARKIVSARNGPPPPAQEYQLGSECDDNSKYHGKVRGKTKTNLDEEETVETPNLPSIPLPISSLPNFNFTLPHTPNVTEKTVTHEPSAFTFASPIKTTTTATNLKSVNNFTFSKPIYADRKHSSNETTSTISAPASMPNFIWSGSSTAPRLKEKAKDSSIPTIATADELKSGSVMDILGNKSHSKSLFGTHEKASSVKSTQESASLKDFDKSSSNDWECSECLIRNSQFETQCIACKASKFKSKTNQTIQSPSTPSSPAEVKPVVSDCFGSQFRLSNSQWECASCCVRNKLADLKCVSCSAPKPRTTTSTESTMSATVTSTGTDLMAKFKPVEGSWECPGCMLRNAATVITCPCCNASKPSSLRMCPKQNKDATCTFTSFSQDTTATVTSASTASPFTSTEKADKKPAKDFWECPSCMVRNAESVTSCPCCTTPKPGSAVSQDKKAQTLPSNGFGDKFKKPEGAWCCDSCMVQNEAKTMECIACGAVKPGCKKGESKETTSSASQFSFGIPPSAGGGFKFGVEKTDAQSRTNTTPSASGFKFGDSQPTSTTGQFTFGIPKDKNQTSGVTAPGSASVVPSNTSNTQSEFQANKEPEKTSMSKPSTEEEKPAASLFSFGMTKSKEPAAANKPFTPGLPTTATAAAPFSFSVQKSDDKQAEVKSEVAKTLFGTSAANVPVASIAPTTVTPVAATSTTTTLPGLITQVGTSENKSSSVFSFGVPSSSGLTSKSTSVVPGLTSLPASTQPSFAFTETKTISTNTTVSAFRQIMTPATTSTIPTMFSFGKNKETGATSPVPTKKQAVLPAASTATPLFPAVPATTSLFGNSDAKTAPVFGATENKSSTFTAPATNPSAFGLPEHKPPPAFSDAAPKPSIFGTSDTKMPVFGSTEKTAPVFNAPAQPSAATPESTPTFGSPTATPSLFGAGTTPVFGNNPPPAFGAGATPNMFSTTKANEGGTPSASLFTFGSTSTPPTQQPPGGGFNFASPTLPGAAAPKQMFLFGSGTNAVPQSNNLFASGTFNPPAAATGSTFTFNAPPKSADPPAFGPSTVTSPIFGAPQPATQTQPAAPPAFTSTPAPNTGFNFGNAVPAPAVGGFNFGAIPSTSSPSRGFNFNPRNATSTVSFDPNAQPSFNFTGGSVPTTFNATPQQSAPRKIKKAVRRMR